MSEARPLHTCTVCGKTAAWGRSWSWYGSALQADAYPDTLDKVCSAACRKKHKPSATCIAAHKRALKEACAVRYPRVYDRPQWR